MASIVVNIKSKSGICEQCNADCTRCEIKRVLGKPQKRKCLSCEKMFRSSGIGNRLCFKCSADIKKLHYQDRKVKGGSPKSRLDRYTDLLGAE